MFDLPYPEAIGTLPVSPTAAALATPTDTFPQVGQVGDPTLPTNPR